MITPYTTLRYAEVLQALNECVVACEELLRNGFSPPPSLLVMNRATVLRWADWSPMLERNPDLADTWLSLCANTCKAWAEAYRHHPADVAQVCVRACERCIAVCDAELEQHARQRVEQRSGEGARLSS
jgi:hypothetical protein